MTSQRIRFVVFRYAHHSPHSGYSRFAEYGVQHFGGQVISVAKPLPKSIIRERLLWQLAKGTPGYTRASMAAELKVAWQMLTESQWIYHFLYGETTYHYTGLLNNVRKNRLLATFHLPPAGMRNAVQIDWHLRRLSAVICLGRNQQDFFADVIDHNRIFFVPLGVDTEYYTPPDVSTRDPNLCLFVGENYRDFPTLRGVIELVTYCRPQTRFVVVTRKQNFDLIGRHPNLNLRTGIPESEFLELYRTAAVMVLPLRDAVANNAVLESLACGLPMVVTDVGATRDYVDSECAVLTSLGDAREMAEAVLGLLENSSKRCEMAQAARRQALLFSWSNVVAQLDSIYAAIA